MKDNKKRPVLVPTFIALLISSQFVNTALAQAIASSAAATGNTVTDTNTNSNLTSGANADTAVSSTDTGSFTSLPITSLDFNTDTNTFSSSTSSLPSTSSSSSTSSFSSSSLLSSSLSSSLTSDTFAPASTSSFSSSSTDNTFATSNTEAPTTSSTTSSFFSSTPFSSSSSSSTTSGFLTSSDITSNAGFNNSTFLSSSARSSSTSSSSSSSSFSSSSRSSSRSSTLSSTASSTSSSSTSFSSSASSTDSSISSSSSSSHSNTNSHSNSITTKPIGTLTTVVDGQTIYSNIYTTITATASVLPGGKQNSGSSGGLSSKNKKIVIGCVVGIGVPLLIVLGILVYYFFIKSKKVNFIDSDGKVVTAVKANKFTKLWYRIFLGKNANDKYDPSSTPPGMEEMEKSNNEGYAHSLRNSGPENITNMNVDNDMFERDVYLDENGNAVTSQGTAAAAAAMNVGRAATVPANPYNNNNHSPTQRNIDGDIVPGRKSYHGQTRSSVGTPYPLNDPFVSGDSNGASSAYNNAHNGGVAPDNRYSDSTTQSQQIHNDMSNKSSSNGNSSNYHDPYADSDGDSASYEDGNNGFNSRNY
ncbi:hypothetical protein ACO0QE_003102 [Hanseniaspora vineae]